MTNEIQNYIDGFPENVRSKLQHLYELIQTNFPGSQSKIAYGMPGFYLHNKPLVYFGGFKKHIGLYALPNANEEFRSELSRFKQGKGSVQFPLNEDIPEDLILRMINFNKKNIENDQS